MTDKENSKNGIGKIVDKIDLDNGWWYCAKDIGRTLAKTKLRSSHRAVIDCILDKTFGWRDSKSGQEEERKKRKIWAYIKGKEFEEYTGLEKTRLSESIKKLVEWNIIKRKIEGWKKQYSFNVNVSQWNKGIFKVKYQKLVVPNRNQLLVTRNRNQLTNISSPKAELMFPQTVTNNRCDTIKNKALPDPKRTKRKELYIKEEEKDHISFSLEKKEKKVVKVGKTEGKEREELFNYWNNYGINPNALITPYIRDIDEALKIYPKEKIQQAISNYVFIIKDEDYYFDHKFTLDTFLKAKHIEKFLNLEDAKSNYKTKTINGNKEDEEDNIAPYSEREKTNTDNYCEYYRGQCLKKDPKKCEECNYKNKYKERN